MSEKIHEIAQAVLQAALDDDLALFPRYQLLLASLVMKHTTETVDNAQDRALIDDRIRAAWATAPAATEEPKQDV